MVVLFGHSCQLVLTAVEDCYLGCLRVLVLFRHLGIASWFWCASDIENCLGHEVLLGHFASWFWHMSDVEDHLWALTAIWTFLPIDSDVCLPLGTVCEHEVLFGYSCQLVLTPDYRWVPFVSTECLLGILPIGSDIWLPLRTVCAREVFVWDCTGHPGRGFMTDLSFDVWACTPYVRLVFLLPYVK